MANPQLENGFTQIANELLEAILTVRLSNYAIRVFMAVIRKTYGYKKKADRISLGQISDLTGIPTSHICRAIKELVDKNMLIKNGSITGINKNYKQWKLPNQAVPNEAILPNQAIKITSSGNKKLPEQVDTKEKKETYTKEIIYIVEYLNQKAKTNYRNNNAKTKELIRARFNDGFLIEDFKKVIDNKVADWKNTEWEKFIRPITLFGTKFESYLNEKPKKEIGGKKIEKL